MVDATTLLNLAQAADFLVARGVGVRLTAAGTPPMAGRAPGSPLFSIADLDAWVRALPARRPGRSIGLTAAV
jgi:hypothetical protein